MLEDIKLLLGITSTDKDELLELLISQATGEAKRLTNNENVAVLRSAIIKMVIYSYNRLGTEGLNSESYSGVSYSYAIDYPEVILRELRSLRKLRML